MSGKLPASPAFDESKEYRNVARLRTDGQGPDDRQHGQPCEQQVAPPLPAEPERGHADLADQPLDLVAVGEALEQLRRLDPPLAELLDQVGFAGLEPAEVAELRGVSLRTVQRELAKAQTAA